MKLIAYIPVEKLQLSDGAYTFTSKRVQVEVLRVIRSPARHDKDVYPWRVTGWYYSVDIAEHPELIPDAYRRGPEGMYRAHVNRALNRKWKPPVFPEGKNWVDVERPCKSN